MPIAIASAIAIAVLIGDADRRDSRPSVKGVIGPVVLWLLWWWMAALPQTGQSRVAVCDGRGEPHAFAEADPHVKRCSDPIETAAIEVHSTQQRQHSQYASHFVQQNQHCTQHTAHS